MRRIHGVEDILLGFEPKDAGSIPAGSVYFKKNLEFVFSLDLPSFFPTAIHPKYNPQNKNANNSGYN